MGPELFSASVLERLREKLRREELATVPYFDGLMAGEPDALVGSFAGEPELHDPVRGRIRGARAFTAFVSEMDAMLTQRNASVENIDHVLTGRGGFGEAVLHLDARCRVARGLRRLARTQESLGRDARPVRALAAHELALHQRDAQATFGKRAGAVLSGQSRRPAR